MQGMAGCQVIADYGLEGDRHARSGSRRQVLLIDREILDSLGLAAGEVKENLTIEGIDLQQLQVGQQLLVGDTVRLEITQPCEPCGRMDEIRAGLRRQLEGRRGWLARVITGGWLAVGDPIRWTGPSESRIA